MGTHATITFTDGTDKAHIGVSSDGGDLGQDVEKFVTAFKAQERHSIIGARWSDVGLTASRFLVYLAGEFAKTSTSVNYEAGETFHKSKVRRHRVAKTNPLIFGTVRIVANPARHGAEYRFVVDCSKGGLVVRQTLPRIKKKIVVPA